MIAYINGKVLSKKNNSLIILDGALGYKIFVGPEIISNSAVGELCELWIYHSIKDDGQALYGFANAEELDFFELLISVSGVGPKSALNIIASAKIGDLKAAIATGDHVPLTRVSGIGKRTAERLVVELKTKVDYLAGPMPVSTGSLLEEIEALVALGYTANEARDALKKTNSELTSAERIRQSLQYL